MTKQFCLSILLVFSSTAFTMQPNDGDSTQPTTFSGEDFIIIDLENSLEKDAPELTSNFTKRQKQIACVACSSCLAVTFFGAIAAKILTKYYTNN